ncbi:transcription-repair coupling factor [Thermodesulfobacterium geofontis OPF15]|uniref:Transcription-repair-coupling factor n=1 Tax=Thermodesulfobacterium geofontis (strain OPF15) TaxID=795359 RepID=F8C2N7_THEGP|nr:transcription-repair coupling factor [Thermodesulfobacterium geofontis]AEH23438.1 transcription-repair coupling factor [Thermodesulfobacterium geofontis OPF15]
MFIFPNFEIFLKNKDYNKEFFISGVNSSFLAYFLSFQLKVLENTFILAIFPEENQAEEFVSALNVFSKEKVALYPTPSLPPFSEAYTFAEEELQRIKILWELPEIKILAGTVEAFLRKTISRENLKKAYYYLILGEKIDRESFLKKLLDLGYERTGVVREKGTFAVKGGIIDLWSPNYESPTRIEFFGNTITGLRFFDPLSQKSFAPLEELIILPCKEIIFTENVEPIYKRLFQFKDKLPESLFTQILSQIENRYIFENRDLLLPIFYEKLNPLWENLKEKEILLILYEPDLIEKNAEKFWDRIYLNASKAKEKKKLYFDETFLYLSLDEFYDFIQDLKKIVVKEIPFELSEPSQKGLTFLLSQKTLDEDKSLNKIDNAFRLLKKSLEEGEKVIFVASDERTEKIVIEGLKFRGLEDFKNLEIRKGILKRGFYLPEWFIWVTSEYELFGKISLKKEISQVALKRAKNYFRKFEDLKIGDFVVHKYHGIGKYLGLTFLKVDGIEGEFLQIEYEGGDKLYLPVSRLNELYPYVGVSDKEPKLDKLGKKTFIIRKKKIEQELREVVQELLALYAERKALKSYSLKFPALAYEEFSSTFPFEETPDQQIAIEEIINDLCSEKPMERLLVGDVGFGKTEVALRAAFLVAYSGKQVAFLVPTTILAEQHYRNFKMRLEPFNIKVGILSRLRPQKEQRETLKKLAEGEIKVVIGTHRLLSSDIIFKDLGLLIIDEEHRFGVKQKEKIKQYKKSIKVLSLSATPIPRSLQLSLLNIFDLSVIETPPPGRKTIKTILAKFEPEIIKSAIERELERGGQVFFVNPRIHGLSSLAHYLKKLVPQARIEIIHGQMPAELIERNMYKFLNKEVDVLLCTPIIGSGIDIPSANTIIINRADMFGLADIYQLRGRVGRSEELAYAYLLVPTLKGLTEEAQKRLKALMQFTEIGSGFRLALSDLKIRGAGELLGIRQSGHINTVGYELYLELLENTVRALKGEKIEDWEPEVNIKVPAYIPANYVPEPEERLSLYRELVLIKDEEELKEFYELIEDKYGKMPDSVENLIKIYLLKLYMKKIGLPLIEVKGNNLVFLIKNQENLLKFRKIFKDLRSNFYFKNEKNFAKIFIRFSENPLDLAINLCKRLLN